MVLKELDVDFGVGLDVAAAVLFVRDPAKVVRGRPIRTQQEGYTPGIRGPFVACGRGRWSRR